MDSSASLSLSADRITSASSTASSLMANRFVVLKSCDGEYLRVKESVALQSDYIKKELERDLVSSSLIQTPKVNGKTLALVLQYCEKHGDPTADEESLKNFDRNFMNKGMEAVSDLVMAASYLEVRDLVELAIDKMLEFTEDMSPEEIHKYFNLDLIFP